MKRFLPLILLLAAVTWPRTDLFGDPLQVAPREGILVLRSGGVLQGAITRAGDEYYVGVAGGEMRLSTADVELVCRDLDEAYRLKQGALRTGHVSEHADLAEWCLRQGLIGYAAKELLAARAADPTFPKLELLQRRLNLAANPVEPRTNDRRVVTTEPHAPATIDAETAALDEMVKRLSPRALESFSSTIQPLLINGCSAAACHGTASNNLLRLERTAIGRPATFRTTQRNLASVLKCIDRRVPETSPLLTLPVGAHGTAGEAVIAAKDLDKYRLLVNWVMLATMNEERPAADSVEPMSPPLLQSFGGRKQSRPNVSPFDPIPGATVTSPAPVENSPAPKRELNSGNLQLGGAENNASEPSGGPSEDEGEPTALPGAIVPQSTTPAARTLRAEQERRGKKFGVPLAPAEATDPFDPDLFNRQFGSGS